ncbi:MAG: hypothetical protein AAF645_04425 [Myxococcota bacterium]
MAPTNPRTLRWAAAAVLVAGAGVGAWMAAPFTRSLPTIGHVLWVDGEGTPIEDGAERFQECGSDFGFVSLIFRGALWASCTEGATVGTGLVRIDPDAGRGQFFEAPDALPYVGTYGLIPHEDGRLGVVYASPGIGEGFAAGVVGQEGWIHAPRAISESSRARFIGGAWVNDQLEVVVRDTRIFRIHRIADEIATRTPLSKLPCVDQTVCRHSDVALRRGGEWRFLVDTDSGLYEANEEGALEASPWDGAADLRDASWYVNNAAFGVVKPGTHFSLRAERTGTVLADGSFEPLAPYPDASWNNAVTNMLAFEGGVLHRRALALHNGTLARKFGGRWVGLSVPGMDVQLTTFDEAHQAREPVNIATRDVHCPFIARGSILQSASGAYWFAHGSGCFFPIDDAFFAPSPP